MLLEKYFILLDKAYVSVHFIYYFHIIYIWISCKYHAMQIEWIIILYFSIFVIFLWNLRIIISKIWQKKIGIVLRAKFPI